MPGTSFKFEVATTKAAAIIFADPFLSRPIAKLLREKELRVKTKSAPKKGPADYIIDCFGSREAIGLAQKQSSKYLRIIIGPYLTPPLENFNWRIIRTDFLLGPRMPENGFLGQLISASVKNEPLVLPSDVNENIYPLDVKDLAEAVWQSLVLPGTANKEFLILGQQANLGKLSLSLQQLGQTTKGIHLSPERKLPRYSTERIQESNKFLNWQPGTDWQEAIEKTFRYFWKKINPEETSPALETTDQNEPAKPGFYVTEEPEPKPEIAPVTAPSPAKTEEPAKEPKPPEKEDQPKEEMIIIEEEPEEPDLDEKAEAEIAEKIVSSFSDNSHPQELSEGKDSTPKNLRWWQMIILFVSLAFILEISVLLKPAAALGLGSWRFKKSVGALSSQSWTKSQQLNRKAKENFISAGNFVKNSRLRWLLFSTREIFSRIAETGEKASRAMETAIPLAQNSLSLAEAILKGENSNFKAAVSQIQSQEKELLFQLATTEALLRGNWNLPLRWKSLPEKLADQINQTTKLLFKAQRITNHLGWLTGADGKRRTFLVLLQNNMELRPTGGFIGSFAILTFEAGSLTNFEVKDVYSADGQLKGHVEPPKAIKEILGEANWYLRDSNWDPDFPKSAQNAEWFLDKELGIGVDGVIGFNLEAAKKMVSAFGEIYLPDFNEKVSADNLFQRAEFWAENEFFPGSNQKKAFLSLLGQQLFENTKAANPEEYLKLFQAVLDSLDQKEILVYAHDQELANTLYQLGWDGSIRKPNCSLENCFSDYIYLVEANLGVNKANYFLRRSLEEAIDFKESGEIVHQLKINYENTAVSNDWPGGKYLNWLRVYLPEKTKVESVVIFDPLDPQNREVVTREKREEEVSGGKKILAFQTVVPIKQRRTVEIVFSQDTALRGEQVGYLLYWQKQSGFRETPISILVSFPPSWQPLQVNPAANLVSGKLLFNQQLDRDLTFGVEFGK
ncbi:MAG: DUF4012 domain-containing protein [Patescibacteria group bacterium]